MATVIPIDKITHLEQLRHFGAGSIVTTASGWAVQLFADGWFATADEKRWSQEKLMAAGPLDVLKRVRKGA